MMSTRKSSHVGIDVSAKTLAVARLDGGGSLVSETFMNDAGGHRALLKCLTKKGRRVRVCLEATGMYSLDIALALHAAPRAEVMVVNPRAARAFAVARMRRGKTDPIDAAMLLEFGERMPFEAWEPPSQKVRALRSVVRRIGALTRTRTTEMNRLHAANASSTTVEFLVVDLEESVEALSRRIESLIAGALGLARSDDVLGRRLELLLSIKGIADKSAVLLLGELAALPADMTAKQWVAHAGLDPRPYKSGTSIHRPDRISKAGNARIRAALFMPAMVATRWEPAVTAFRDHLVARGKKPRQATVAIMRKFLHAIHAMWLTDRRFDPTRFHNPQLRVSAENVGGKAQHA
jgi:transposase